MLEFVVMHQNVRYSLRSCTNRVEALFGVHITLQQQAVEQRQHLSTATQVRNDKEGAKRAGPVPITVRNKPRPNTIGDGQMLTFLTAQTGNILRFFHGAFGLDYKISLGKPEAGKYRAFRFLGWELIETAQPTSVNLKHPIEVYEYEMSASSKKVREASSTLALDVKVFPCP